MHSQAHHKRPRLSFILPVLLILAVAGCIIFLMKMDVPAPQHVVEIELDAKTFAQ